MVPQLSKRWLHPQTVPRGFLRLYIMTQLSKGPQTGYSLMQRIEEKTEGAWRPGPGTMYPLLKGLVAQKLAKATDSSDGHWTKAYALTDGGRKELKEIRESFAGAGRKEPVMSRLFSDLLPGASFIQMVIRRYREGAEILRAKLAEIPEAQREEVLNELRALSESQLRWIDDELGQIPSHRATKGKRTRTHP